jgi:hypothetical protein
MKKKAKYIKYRENTYYPFWIIIDSKLTHGFEGIWFSRESAQLHLINNSEKYSSEAYVYCKSGAFSEDFRNLIEDK